MWKILSKYKQHYVLEYIIITWGEHWGRVILNTQGGFDGHANSGMSIEFTGKCVNEMYHGHLNTIDLVEERML